MIKWAIIFAVIGLIAGALGFAGIGGAAIGIAKFLFWAAGSTNNIATWRPSWDRWPIH